MKKKILVISCDGLGNGGVQAVFMGIVRMLHSEYDFDCVVFTEESEGSDVNNYYEKEFLHYGGQIFRIPLYAGSNLIRKKTDYYLRGSYIYRSVCRIIKSNGPYHGVHCHNEYESALVLKAAYRYGVPVRITHAHIIYKEHNFMYNSLVGFRRRCIEKYATRKVGCSLEACHSMFLNYQQTTLLNNPYNEAKFFIRKDARKYSEGIQLIQIGRYCASKNQLFSIRVLEEIVRFHPKSRMVLVGFSLGTYIEELMVYVNAHNLGDNVLFLPGDADSEQLLSESHAMIFPSLDEGFGIVLIEAQAAGTMGYASDTVPRATNCGGVKYLSLHSDPKTWAQEIMDDYRAGRLTIPCPYDVEKYGYASVEASVRWLYLE